MARSWWLPACIALTLTLVAASPVATAVASQTSEPSSAVPAAVPHAPAGSTAGPGVEIAITDAGFVPPTAAVGVGQSVHWTNRSGHTHNVTGWEGLFASGNLPPGAGFSIAIAITGTHPFSSTLDSTYFGALDVGTLTLPGPDTDLVANHIPDTGYPPALAANISVHPTWGVEASRTRILLGFTPAATVGQANAALQTAGVVVIGGLAKEGMLLVEAPDTPDFSGLATSLASLRADPSVQFAAMSFKGAEKVVPPEAESAIATGLTKWAWPVTMGANGAPQVSGTNYGLELSRLPQAWNFLEAVRHTNAGIQTGVIDGGFDPAHPDLQGVFTLEHLCNGAVCTVNDPKDHGTHVAGIIGAAYNNPSTEAGRSLGVSGVNPTAAIFALPANGLPLSWHWYTGSLATHADTADVWDGNMQYFDLLLGARERGALPNLRVINYSMAFMGSFQADPVTHVALWWKAFPAQTCGGTWCTPNNEPGWLAEAAHAGQAALRVAQRAATDNVMIVQAAGNESNELCLGAGGGVACNAAGATPVLMQAANVTEFGWASHNWPVVLTLPNPIFSVEAIDAAAARAPFSNVGGDISAPGRWVLSTIPAVPTGPTVWTANNLITTGAGTHYGLMSGTSMAAPHITGVIGYLLAYSRTLTIPQVRAALTTWARADTTDHASPRVDAFASLLSLPGAAKALVDVNDQSDDGNRRVIRGPGNVEIGIDSSFSATPGAMTAPDGRVDMRDFRRFRDAWLETCLVSPGRDAECPPKDSILLDGDVDGTHPKKDLNFDGCTNPGTNPTTCPTGEYAFPRFDFNGDGRISISPSSRQDLPLRVDGSPASGPDDPLRKWDGWTDLDVLASQWDPDPAHTEGWTANDLGAGDEWNLMVSGDLEIHLKDFFAAGASQATVQVSRPEWGDVRTRVVKSSDPQTIIFTVPVNRPLVAAGAGTEVDVQVIATNASGAPIPSAVEKFTLHPGEDRRIDPFMQLVLTTADSQVPADGSATTTVTATVRSATPTVQAGRPITLTLSAGGDAALAPLSGSLDSAGRFKATFTAGRLVEQYTITGTVSLADGSVLRGTVGLSTVAPLYVAYTWHQDTKAWQDSGSTRWPGTTSAQPDCTDPGVAATVGYCIDRWQIGPAAVQPSQGLTRTGTLSGAASYFRLTEQISPTLNSSYATWTVSNPDGTNPRDGNATFQWAPLNSQLNRYSNFLVTGLSAQDTTEGVRLGGLRAVGELGYQYALTEVSGSVPPIETWSTRPDLALVPRGDGSALQATSYYTQSVYFPRTATGGLGPYAFCETPVKDLTTQRGYMAASSSTWFPGASDLTRLSTYAAGERPMPTGPGSLTRSYAFAAVAGYDPATLPKPAPPDCTAPHPPKADFDFSPATPGEGDVVFFHDRSTDPIGDIVSWTWDFGDGVTSTAQDPGVHIYADNLSTNVRLTVTDRAGNTDTKVLPIVVHNLPPEPEIDTVTGQAGQTIAVPGRLYDPGQIDRQALQYVLSSDTNAFVSVQNTVPAGKYIFNIPPLAAGQYPITLAVTDPDGTTASAHATITVLPSPPPSPPKDAAPYVVCASTATLDAQEQQFLNLVNAYRLQHGLPPVSPSPTLTQAARAHAQDMVAHNYMGHTGSDGSTPWTRAKQAGYPGTEVGENVAAGPGLGIDVLLGWKISPPHNRNMLDPDWKAIGIARAAGTSADTYPWYWSTSYGNLVDCGPTGTGPAAPVGGQTAAPSPSPSAPTSSAGALAGPAAGSAAAALGPAATPAASSAPVKMVAPDDSPAALNVPQITVNGPTPAATQQPAAPAPATSQASGAGTGSLTAQLPWLTAATAGPSATTPALSPVPALEVLPAALLPAHPVTVTNDSRDATGAPLAAVLNLGDGSPTVTLAPGASQSHAYAGPGSYTVVMTATDSAGQTLAVARPVPVAAPAQAAFTTGKGINVAALEDGAAVVGYSSAAGTTIWSGAPQAAIDNWFRDTYWLSAAGQTTNQWLKISLAGGNSYLIDHVELRGRVNSQPDARALKDFAVRVSNTGTADADFTTVASGSLPEDQYFHTYSFAPVQARYVELLAIDNWGDPTNLSLCDFAVWTPDRDGGIVSLPFGPRATVAGVSTQYPNSAANAIDGNPNTSWLPGDPFTFPAWLKVQLGGGQTYTIDRVLLQSGYSYGAVKNFEIRASTTTADDLAFTSVYSGTLPQGSAPQTFTLAAPVQARYLELLVWSSYSGSGFSLADFEAFTPEGRNAAAGRNPPDASVAPSSDGVGARVVDSSAPETAASAIDFEPNMFWRQGSPNTTWYTAGTTNQWLKLVLQPGTPNLVDRVALTGSGNCGPKDFQIRVATAGSADVDFTAVYTGTLPSDYYQHWFTFPPVPATWVELYVFNNRYPYGCNILVPDFEVGSPQGGGATARFVDRSNVAPWMTAAHSWSFGDGSTSTEPNPQHTFPGPGTYTVTLTLDDGTGTPTTASLPYTVQAPPAADFTYTPNLPTEGTTIYFTDTSTAGAGSPELTRFWQSGSLIANWQVLRSTWNGWYPDNGNYPVTLRAVNEQLIGASTTKILPVANLPPIVNLSAPSSLAWGQDWYASLGVNVSDPSPVDMLSLVCDWNLGDGTAVHVVNCTSDTARIHHSWARPGAYTVTLTVTDKDGGVTTATSSLTVTKRQALANIFAASGVDAGGTVTVTARLWDVFDPTTIPMTRTLAFALAAQQITATTDAGGVGRAGLAFATGITNTVTAGFAGDDLYLPSTDSATFRPVSVWPALPILSHPKSKVVALVPNATGGLTAAGALSSYGFRNGYQPLFVNTAPDAIAAATVPDPLADVDTAVLNRVCDIGSSSRLGSPTFRGRLQSFLARGGKLIIWDTPCTGTDYSNFFYPFTTDNPGAVPWVQGGGIQIVENSTLGNNTAFSPYFVDAIQLASQSSAAYGANVFLDGYNSNWCTAMDAHNKDLSVYKPVHLYAGYGPGLIIYSGLSYLWMEPDAQYNQYGSYNLGRVWELELEQPWNPSGLPCTSSQQATLALTPASAQLRLGLTFAVTATVTGATGQPLAGLSVRLEVTGANPATLIQTTGSDGKAHFQYTGLYPGIDTLVARLGANNSNTATVAWLANTPPILAPVPPLTTTVGALLAYPLTATDLDLPPQRLLFSLDAPVPAGASVDALSGVFSWTPAAGQAGTYHLTARVTDNGTPPLSDTQPMTVTVIQPSGPDFLLGLAPSTATLPPGGTAGFAVRLASLAGFSKPVTLTVGPLPAGVTAQFATNPITPTATTILTLAAAPTANTGAFAFSVTASGGGVTHSASSQVSLNFGLVPLCYGAFLGSVTDSTGGAPLANAVVHLSDGQSAVTGPDGRYSIGSVPLNANNAPAIYDLRADANGYWYGQASDAAVCGQVTVVNFTLLAQQQGSVAGNVYVGIADPKNPAVVTPTTTLIPGASVNVSGQSLTADANGRYVSGPLALAYGNQPATYGVTGNAAGYWSGSASATIQANQTTQANLALVAVCAPASVIGHVTYADTGEFAPGASVALKQSAVSYRITMADASGGFQFTGVPLGYNNGPAGYLLSATAPAGVDGYQPSEVDISVSGCGQVNVFTVALQRAPVVIQNYGSISGHAYDAETSLPLAGVLVAAGGASAASDATGAYTLTHVLVGANPITTAQLMVGATLTGYWPGSATVTVTANQNTTADLRLLRMRYGAIAGTIRDALSGQPIAGAQATLPGASPTGIDGAYASGPLDLSPGNQPRVYPFTVTATGYWPASPQAPITASVTTHLDVPLVQICTGATIGGKVINAWTLQPIAGATVTAAGKSATTDGQGLFQLAGIQVGNDNTPTAVTVTASAAGFYPQSETVTIFCGASITIVFGQPQTAFGAIEGWITNAATNQPLAGVFVGSQFGAATSTDANGHYRFDQVPLGLGGAAQAWQVTAMPAGYPGQTKSVTVSANATSRLDFAFGGTPPNHPPVYTPPADQQASAGASQSFSLGTFTDPDPAEANWGVRVAWGDNSSDLTFTAAAPGSLGTRTHTYAATGAYTVTVTVTDPLAAALSSAGRFHVAVPAVSDVPVLGPIADQTVLMNHVAGPITFTVSDPVTPLGQLTLTAKSSDPVLLPQANITLGGQLGSRTITLQPAANHTGVVTVTLTVSNGKNSVDGSFRLNVVQPNAMPLKHIYLPLVVNRFTGLPDLVVSRLTPTTNNVVVEIRNQGQGPVRDPFWVDVYIAPRSAPVKANDVWWKLSNLGWTWGIPSSALPLWPGQTLTLSFGDKYYWPSESHMVWPLAVGTPIYAQADSADTLTDYGSVWETHEALGLPYNNVAGPVLVTAAPAAPAARTRTGESGLPSPEGLPLRPSGAVAK